MEQLYESEIKLLQEEIAMLENQQENNEREVMLHFEEYTQRTLTLQPDLRKGKNDAAMDLEKLEEDLSRQTKINGIALQECEVKTLEKSETKIVQQHRATGNCSFLGFQVEFELTEILEEDGTIVRRITDLNIVVDGCEFIGITAFVSGVEETKSLLLFFRALRSFAERCEHRTRTFAHFKLVLTLFVLMVKSTPRFYSFTDGLAKAFNLMHNTTKPMISRSSSQVCEQHKSSVFLDCCRFNPDGLNGVSQEKYPEEVRLPEGCRGEVMVIQSPKIPGCTLSIVWSISVTKDGVIIPKVDLLTKQPEQALGLDQRKLVENAPRSFQSLLRILGVEAAIQALIAAVCAE